MKDTKDMYIEIDTYMTDNIGDKYTNDRKHWHTDRHDRHHRWLLDITDSIYALLTDSKQKEDEESEQRFFIVWDAQKIKLADAKTNNIITGFERSVLKYWILTIFGYMTDRETNQPTSRRTWGLKREVTLTIKRIWTPYFSF